MIESSKAMFEAAKGAPIAVVLILALVGGGSAFGMKVFGYTIVEVTRPNYLTEQQKQGQAIQIEAVKQHEQEKKRAEFRQWLGVAIHDAIKKECPR